MRIVLIGAVLCGAAAIAGCQPLQYTGVNLAGGDFYDPVKVAEPVFGTNFIYPNKAEFEYFAAKGMNVFRLPFMWETIQPKAKGPFREAEIARLKAVVKTGTDMGLTVLLDPHNYARYYGKVVGGPEVGIDAFADLWGKLAAEFANDEHVWFGLVNEPHDMPTEQWLNAANAAIAAIRSAGAKNLILVPGNAWTGASGWLGDWYGGANGTWMLKIEDPADNYAYEVHQYLDSDGSGSHPEVVSATIGSERLKAFVQWCRDHKKRAFLGEFGTGVGDMQKQAIEDMLSAMERDRDVWLGWTWWAAGAWWGEYMFTLE
jgi:endoglucanase